MSKDHVRVLKTAKSLITKHQFVCIAIQFQSSYNEDQHIKSDLIDLIEKSLGSDEDGQRTVGEWLYQVHGIKASTVELHEYRLAWIDNMIEYWHDRI